MRYACALMVLLTLACSKKAETTEPTAEPSPPEPKPAAQSAPARQKPTQPAAATARTPSLELLGAGEMPRRALRRQFEKGAKHELRMRAQSTVQMQLPTQLMPETVSPAIIYDVALSVEEVAEDGSAQAVFGIEGIEIEEGGDADKALNTEVRDALASLKGWKGRLSVDARGMVTEVEIDAPADASSTSLQLADGIKTQLFSLSVPIPEQELGKGARWTITRELEETGIQAVEVTTVDLDSIEDETAKLRIEVMQSADPQVVTPPGAESYRLGGYSSNGKAKAVVKLTQLIPVSYDGKASSIMMMSRRGSGGQSQIVSVTTKTKLKITEK